MNQEIDIKTNNIGIIFQKGSKQVITLEGVNFEVKRGEFFCIVGPSSCGKSTLLKILIGLLKPTSGNVYLNQERYKQGIAYIPQSSALLPWRTLLQNASLGLELKGAINANKNQTLKYLIQQYGLEGFENLLPQELSGGMRQRVDLIRALASEPKLLFCDEPFSAIDFVSRLELNMTFKNRCAEIGTTTVFVTHNIEEAIFLGDTIAVMARHPGRIFKIYHPNLPFSNDAVKSRESPEFSALFVQIWNDLKDVHTQSNKNS